VGDDLGENRNTLRFYFNFNPEPIFNEVTGAEDSFLIDFQTKFAEILFDNFNTRKIPFHLKIAQNRSKFYADNVVLYLERRYLNTMLNIFNENYHRFRHLLRTEVPMFTYKLYDGIGFAEGIELSYPEESFGRNKATFISELYDKITYKMQKEAFVLRDEIEKLLKEYRTDCKLFLNKDSKFEYVRFGDLEDKNPPIKNDKIITDALVEYVMKLGYEICKYAFWDDRGRCNWIGYSNEKSYKPLNLRYLDGIGGVLLFLSEAYVVTGDVLFKRFGQGTLESIFEKINQQQSKFLSQRGFHKGAGGLIYVVQKAIIAFELKNEFQDKFDNELLTKVLDSQDFKNAPYDIYGGTSGTLLGLLMVKKLLGNEFAKYDNKVLQIKNKLLEGNELWKTDEYFNDSIQGKHERMVGFPHGVSGIAYSLGLYQKNYNDNSQQITDKINEAFIFEENNRRNGELWIDSIQVEKGSKRPPTTGWEQGLTAVGFSQIGMCYIGMNGRSIKNINKIVQYCTTKETILTSFRNISSGVLDFFIECNSLTLNNGSFILEQIKPMIQELENNNLDLRNDSNDSNFVHPGLIGISGFALSLIRLHSLSKAHSQNFQPVSSCILPS
jgi:lantibiotic modifying enzyme